jgi:hypothetical protein
MFGKHGKRRRLDGLSIFLLSVSGLLVVYVLFRIFRKPVQDAIIKEQAKKKATEESTSTEDTIRLRELYPIFESTVIKNGGDKNFAFLLMGQAIHESSERGLDKLYHPFTSSVFINNNNCFGMRPAIERQKDQSGEKGGYALYDSIEQCVYDRLLWEKAHELPIIGLGIDYDSVRNWVSTLKKKKYFEASLTEYCAGVWNAVKKIKSI